MSWIKFLVTLVWPFVKEMILGGKTLVEAFKENKKRVIFAIFVMASFLLNAVAISRILAISREHVVLQQKYDALLQGSKQNPIHNEVEVKQNKEPTPTPVTPAVAAMEPNKETPQRAVPKTTPRKNKASDERFNHLQATFETIRERERKEEEATRNQ